MPKSKMQNQALRPLKDVLKNQYAKKNLEKMAFFVSYLTLEGVPNFFSNAVFISLVTEWWNEHREPAPVTEIGVAAFRGEDIITFARDANASLEAFFSKIIAWHIRPKETCHKVGRGDWIQKGAEERFLFGTTSFQNEEFLAKTFSEEFWQMGDERRSIVLVGQAVYQDYNTIKKSFRIDLIGGHGIMDIVVSAAQNIKANANSFRDCITYCHRSDSTAHLASACTIPPCARCGSKEHVAYKCKHCGERDHPADKCRDKME